MPPPHLIIVIKSIISFYHANSSLFSDNLSKFYHTLGLVVGIKKHALLSQQKLSWQNQLTHIIGVLLVLNISI